MQKVFSQLNQIQADAHAFYLAFHGYHWFVKGKDFAVLHAYTEEAYEEFGKLFDDTAERALILGGKAVTGAENLLKLAKAPVVTKESFSSCEVFGLVKTSYEYLLGEFKKLEEVAGEAGDSVTEAFAQDNIASLQKKLWMLNSTLVECTL